ncbi:MAG: tetratricopeptide repeat protein, partial [Gemmataceae bacterium]|nr:tetratricopeptide repeat protein [Gemmataceae bacterium]
MGRGGGRLLRPWRWPWWTWLIAAGVAAVGWWGGTQAWAWQQRRAGAAALHRYHAAQAREHLEACLRVWPADRVARLLAIRAARRAGDFAAAEDHVRAYERLVAPSDEALAFEWALVRAAAGDIDIQLDEYLTQQLEAAPVVAPLIYEALVEGYTRSYRIKEAFDVAERWLALEPDNVQALFRRGSIHRQIGKLQKGVDDFQRALDLDPQRDDVRKLLAIGLIDGGRYHEALSHLDALRRRTPADADIVALQGRAL